MSNANRGTRRTERPLIPSMHVLLWVVAALVSGCDDVRARPSASATQPASRAEVALPTPAGPTPPVPTPPAPIPTPNTSPTVRSQGGVCRVAQETVLAENDQPARGVAVAFARGRGVAAWPSAAGRVSLQPIDETGATRGAVVEVEIDHARSIHALVPIGERWVLMTRGACVHPPSPGRLHCSAYVGLDAALAPTGPQIVLPHGNQSHVGARIALGDAVVFAVVMESWQDTAGLSAPSFDIELHRLAFSASGVLEVTRIDIEEPGEEGDDAVYAALAPCADGATACGVVCAERANRCAPIGIEGRRFRSAITGGKPQAVVCDGDGCDVAFRRGPTVRGTHIGSDGSTQGIEVASPGADATLTAAIEEGRLVRLDPTGAIIGPPLEIAARDARASVTWTGARYLAASLSRRGGTTRYTLASITCEPAPPSP